MSLLSLPDYLLETFLKDYLAVGEWRNTMNVSVQFADQKKRSIFLNLNNSFAQQFCFEKNFRDRVVSIICDKRRQIGLDLRSTPTVLSKHLSVIDGVHSVNLANNQQLVDVNMLSHVMKLDLSGCHSIQDVSNLSEVVQLILPRCYELRSLRGLEQVSTLNISGCHLIQDVSMLKKVESLTVTNCPNISDLSPLANTVHELSFTHCKGVTNVPSLTAVKSVNLSYCENLIETANLPAAERITLNYCTKLKKVGKLPHAREIHLIGCKGIALDEFLCQLSNSPIDVITVCKCQGTSLLQQQQQQQSESQNNQQQDQQQILATMIKKVKMTPSCLCA